jgi:hypothetical protein
MMAQPAAPHPVQRAWNMLVGAFVGAEGGVGHSTYPTFRDG